MNLRLRVVNFSELKQELNAARFGKLNKDTTRKVFVNGADAAGEVDRYLSDDPQVARYVIVKTAVVREVEERKHRGKRLGPDFVKAKFFLGSLAQERPTTFLVFDWVGEFGYVHQGGIADAFLSRVHGLRIENIEQEDQKLKVFIEQGVSTRGGFTLQDEGEQDLTSKESSHRFKNLILQTNRMVSNLYRDSKSGGLVGCHAEMIAKKGFQHSKLAYFFQHWQPDGLLLSAGCVHP